jgi:NitT/TauT family transport system substrate-binding protein
MRDAYAAGTLHVGWATLDMLPLMLEGLRKDSRVMPRVYQQVDWSNGGDGIVVREDIKTMADLRGKRVVLAQNSPSHFFVLNALINAGVQPGEVDFKFTQDAFQAAAAFNADKTISGVVTWAPDIYNLEKVKGNRMMVTTSTANKLIADVWFARADFAKDNPDIMEGLTRGIFDAMEDLKVQEAKIKASKLMATGYSIPEADALGMMGDAHSTNYAENRDFFMNQNNPTSFERTWTTAYFLYKRINAVTQQTPFDQVMDFSVLQKLGAEAKYANQKNEYDVHFAPASAGTVAGEKNEILTKTVVVHFFPNSWDLNKKITRTADNGKEIEELYDPNVSAVVEEVGKLAGQYGAARIVIEGHSDGSMRGQVPPNVVQELSLNRANAVKEGCCAKFRRCSRTSFRQPASAGTGRPTQPTRRTTPRTGAVEIKVFPAEVDHQVDAVALCAAGEPASAGRPAARRGRVAVVFLLWWLATWGNAEQRMISPVILPSPYEVAISLPALFRIARCSRASRRRSARARRFGLAVLIGVPLGILAGAWRVLAAAAARSRSSAATCRSRR